jgi:Holliday junction resolvase RusA-like endonuclease
MSELLLELIVAGKPEPQGSTRAWVPTDKKGRPFRRADGSIVVNVTSDNPALKKWREKVAAAARAEWRGPPLDGVSLMVEGDFFLYRAQDQWGTGRNAHLLKEWAPAAPLGTPDVDKLLRAVLDSLTGVVYRDDSLVTLASSEKHSAVPGEHNDGQGVILKVLRRDAQRAADLPEAERTRYVVREQMALV